MTMEKIVPAEVAGALQLVTEENLCKTAYYCSTTA